MGIAALFAKVDDALTERASISTIRGMLFMLLDQAEATETDLESIKERWNRSSLAKENDRLRLNLHEAYDLIERLQNEADERTKALPEIQDDILVCIAHLGPHKTDDLVESLNLGCQSIHFHLEELQSRNFVEVDSDFCWAIRRDVYRYLKERQLFEYV